MIDTITTKEFYTFDRLPPLLMTLSDREGYFNYWNLLNSKFRKLQHKLDIGN